MSNSLNGESDLNAVNQRLAMLYLLRRVAERINTGQDGGEGNGGSLVERERRGGEEADIDYEDEDEQEDDEEYNEQEDDEEDDEQEHDDEYDEEDDEEDGEEDDGDAESRTPLCSICQKINITRKSFEPNKRDKNAGWGSHTLGTLDEIRKRQSCPICSLVVKAIEEYPSSTGKEGPFRLEWGSDRLTSNDSHELTQTSELYIYRGNRMLYEETFKAKGHIALLGAGPFLARRIGDTIDLQQVRGWLSNCAEWHGENCNKPLFEQLGSPSELPHFRVIDVQEGCLATLPPGARYLALSYCWGAVESLVAVRTNADQLGEPRGIFNASQEVASTIKEAIALTSELGERYLWVDQLCIIQDETEIKAELINNMDKIYGHAHLVIVAASGSDANAGLPGIGGRPRGIVQAIAEIEPGFEVALLPYPVDTEDDDDKEKEEVQSSGPTTITLYERAIEEISQRSLSYQTDALNVAAGLLQIIEAKDKTKAYFGIPEVYFDSILLWLPGHSKGFNRRHGFPSWSWTGWVGAIRRYVQAQPLEVAGRSPSTWIIWQLVTSEGNVTQLRTDAVEAAADSTVLDPASSERAKHYFTLFDTDSLPRTETEAGASSAPDQEPRPGGLHFWTVTCKLRAQAQVEITDFRLAGDQSKAHKHPIMDLVDSRGAFAGRVVLHPERGVPFAIDMEFVVHSLSPRYDEGVHYLGFISYDEDKELGLGIYALESGRKLGQAERSDSDEEEEEEEEGEEEEGEEEEEEGEEEEEEAKDEQQQDGKGSPKSSEPGLKVPPPTPAEPSTEASKEAAAGSQSEDPNEERLDENEETMSDYITQAYPPLKQRQQWRFFNVIAIRRHDDGVAERIGIGKILESAIRDSFDGGPVWSEVIWS